MQHIRNSAKFRGIPAKFYCKNSPELRVFQKIPYSAGSKKSTSVDTLDTVDTAEIKTGMAENSSPGTRQTDGKNLVWFGEIERKLAKLSMPTFTCRSSF